MAADVPNPQVSLDWERLPGRLIVLSGASGSGKSTLVDRLLARTNLRIARSISATSRDPRPSEVDGESYFFMTKDVFKSIRKQGGFLEYAMVHDNYYGTPTSSVVEALEQGTSVILVIDVQGAMQVRSRVNNALLIFVHAPDHETLEARLRARGTDDEATILKRLANARRENELAECYDYQIVNDDLDSTVDVLATILSITTAEVVPTMLEELKEEHIVNKVGGRFKLSTLIQKRMIALNQGSRPLIDARGLDKMSTVIQEIMQDKIYLDMSGNLHLMEATEEEEGGTVDLTQPSE